MVDYNFTFEYIKVPGKKNLHNNPIYLAIHKIEYIIYTSTVLRVPYTYTYYPNYYTSVYNILYYMPATEMVMTRQKETNNIVCTCSINNVK